MILEGPVSGATVARSLTDRHLLAGKSEECPGTGAVVSAALFEGIAALPGLRLISLQKYEGMDQLGALPGEVKIETLGEDFDAAPHAFVDSAAVMESLDLVITSDTAIAHLAGALGRPGFVGLKRASDWRWMLDRSDGPWYPTLILFRQKQRGDWGSVFAAMQARLIERMASKPAGGP